MVQLNDPLVREVLDYVWVYVWVVAGSIGVVFAWNGWKQGRRRWIEWQWQRRLARMPPPGIEEVRDYHWALERLDDTATDKPRQFNLEKGVLHVLFMTCIVVGSFVVALLFKLDWELTVGAAALAGSAIAWLWQTARPEIDRDVPFDGMGREPRELTIPPEALTGAVAAAAVIGAIGLLIWLV